MLTIPAEDTKTHEEHSLPIPDVVVQMLRERRKVRRIDNDYVFPGEGGSGHLVEPKRSIEQVRKLTAKADPDGKSVPFSMHTLRRTFETIAARQNIPYFALKKLFNHATTGDITARYAVLKWSSYASRCRIIADFIKLKVGLVCADEQVDSESV